MVLITQFCLFSNQFYLLMAISQFFDELKVGFLFSYIAPLAFVLLIVFIKEALDDIYRYKRDQETNNSEYNKITLQGIKRIKARDIKIGDVIELHQNEKAPADMIILKSFEENAGGAFIRTDQLDGETDWKLRKAPPSTQSLQSINDILIKNMLIVVDPPGRKIYEFNGVLVHLEKFDSRNVKIDDKRSNDQNAENEIKLDIEALDGNDKYTDVEVHDALSLENTLWSNTVLASQKVIALVIYTGKETRAQMNSAIPRSKIGVLDLEINTLSKLLFIIMIICSLIMIILRGLKMSAYSEFIGFFRFLVLFCSIIPISLRTNLDISKTVNSEKIENNELIPETLVRNSTIPEELGRIEYIFSDKTGTLTNNVMKMKRLSVSIEKFLEDNKNDLKLILEDECKNYDYPASDLIAIHQKTNMLKFQQNINKDNSEQNDNIINEIDNSARRSIQSKRNSLNNEFAQYVNNYSERRIRRNNGKIIRDTITALALCNNVTPIKLSGKYNREDYKELEGAEKKDNQTNFDNVSRNYIEKNRDKENLQEINNSIIKNDSEKQNVINADFNYDAVNENSQTLEAKYEYQASSPDEVALVQFCEELKIKLIYRTDKIIKIQNANQCIEEYEILANFPFSSETKRMGIIVKNLKSEQIIFYLKGAENVIVDFVKDDYKQYIKEFSEELANLGLRTLAVTQKLLEKSFFDDWIAKYNSACVSMDNRKEKIKNVISLLENNMEFLTVTGVEDQLQEEVYETLDSMKNAGIKVWMLTGDKVETALCIAISTGLKGKNQRVEILKENTSVGYISDSLERMKYIGEFVLVIDGSCLEVALTQLEKLFFEVSLSVKIICLLNINLLKFYYIGCCSCMLQVFANTKSQNCEKYKKIF